MLPTLTLVLPLCLLGCSTTSLSPPVVVPESDQKPPTAAGQWLGSLALPAGSAIKADQSLIIGSGESWVGRAVLDVGRDADAAYRFFLDNLPAQGWTVVAAVRGRQSLLVMSRQERTLTIEMSEPMLGLPGISLPVIANVHAGSWLIAVVLTDFMTASMSTTLAVCGRSSLIHEPDWPWRWNL